MLSESWPDLGTIIMAGGKSSRMGTNKALLRLEPGGLTLIELVVAAARQIGPPLLVTNTPQDYEFLGLPMVPDAVAGSGPLAGLYSGLAAAQHEYNLILACDMPRLNGDLLRYMAALPRDYDVLIPRWRDPEGEQQLETLHAIYSRACLPAIEKRLQAGKLRMISFHPDVRVRYVEEDEIRRFDPQLTGFGNLNTPEDVRRVTSEG
jgi:molybdopterin-guanine dinucleotide biosynthesis protein A